MENHAILADDKLQYQKEQDQLLQTILDYRFFNPWKEISSVGFKYSLWQDSKLEIYITNACNQKCEYCYLTKYPQLYPADKTDPKIILKNLSILYDYILLNQYHIPLLDFFSGEIWHTQFGIEILRLTLDYIKKGMQIDSILVTSNCSFIENNESFHKIQTLITEFEEIGCRLQFSISVDGKIVDNTSRPRANDKKYTDDFYDKLFTFAKMNNYFFHPMISSSNVKHWKENYQWWEDMHDYYNMDIMNMMMLEVRNSDWTDESIKDYCELMTFLMDKYYEKQCHKDFKLFAHLIGNIRLDEVDNLPLLHGYVPWILNEADNFQSCTISTHLTVRIGDLAICPCHRTSYDKYLYGYFTIENDMITGIRAVNPYMAIRTLMGNVHTINPRCSMCIYNNCCLHGCLGSQIETNSDPFFPNDNVCKFFKAKYHAIIQNYREKGLIEYFKTISPYELNAEHVAYILNLDRLDHEVMTDGMGSH